MNEHPQPVFASIIVSWLGTAAAFLSNHIHVVLSILCGFASLMASFYAIRVSRATLKLREKQLKDAKRRSPFLPAAIALATMLFGGCASQPTAFDRAFFNIQTNYAPIVHVFTNTVQVTNTVVLTNTVREVIERPVMVQVTNDVGSVTITTNINLTTNITLVTVVSNFVSPSNVVAAVTNLTPVSVSLTPNQTATNASTFVGAVAGTVGWGGVATTAFAGLLGVYARFRSRKLTEALTGQLSESSALSEALAQGIETARVVLQTTPQGQQLDAQYKAWLISHQQAAGIIGAAATLAEGVDNQAAKAAAALIKPPQPQI